MGERKKPWLCWLNPQMPGLADVPEAISSVEVCCKGGRGRCLGCRARPSASGTGETRMVPLLFFPVLDPGEEAWEMAAAFQCSDWEPGALPPTAVLASVYLLQLVALAPLSSPSS